MGNVIIVLIMTTARDGVSSRLLNADGASCPSNAAVGELLLKLQWNIISITIIIIIVIIVVVIISLHISAYQ